MPVEILVFHKKNLGHVACSGHHWQQEAWCRTASSIEEYIFFKYVNATEQHFECFPKWRHVVKNIAYASWGNVTLAIF